MSWKANAAIMITVPFPQRAPRMNLNRKRAAQAYQHPKSLIPGYNIKSKEEPIYYYLWGRNTNQQNNGI